MPFLVQFHKYITWYLYYYNIIYEQSFRERKEKKERKSEHSNNIKIKQKQFY